ncbi:MAG: TonB-dependent receptor domain-containing protein [Chitinophagaceae bacterium]
MKQILTLLTVVLTSITSISYAQTKPGKVTGNVIDGSSKRIEAATVSLLKAKDSSAVKFSTADKSGNFEFDGIAEGRYLVSVTTVGHTKGFSETFEINDQNSTVRLKTIELVPQAKSIGGVTVTANRPLIEQKIDRTIVNVEASVTNVGSSALEVLEKSPGVTVDKDGNISLKGKAGVMVLVDGRPTQLGGTDLANLLRNLNASQLDQIEIMTNHPAKYDAAGNAGIINIKTKKNKQVGYNGTVTVGYGRGKHSRFNEALNLNYRNSKVNLFTNLSHNYRKREQELDIQRNFLNRTSKEIMSFFDQEARMTNKFNSFNAKIGLDYFASKNTSFGFVVGTFSNPGRFTNNNTTLIYAPPGSLVSQTKALSIADEQFRNFSTNLNFRQQLDTTGKELTADLDYITYDATTEQSLSNYYFDAAGNTNAKGDTLYGNLPQDIQIITGKIDYLHPLKKGARFEAGVKTSFIKTDNNALYDTLSNGILMHDNNRSNHFLYEENINAAYVNLSTPLSKKINAQFGLRLENTISKGNQLTTGEKFNRPYTQLFPTAYLQYVANEKNSIVLNYGRRIRRPNYESLNPFIEYLDRYTYQQGNPNLKPQFSHNIELSHTHKNFLTTTLNYTRTTDIIQQVIEQNTERNETYVKQSNIANQRQYGIALNVAKPITKWWTNNLYVNVSNNRFSGIVDSTQVTVDATMLMLNGSQQFKITKTFSAEISGFFRTAGVEGVIKSKPMGMVSAGFSQQVFKGKGTVRLNVRDIFYTQKFRGESKYGSVDASFQERGDNRAVNLGFTYRFSKGKINGAPKRKTGGASDEQNRVGGNQN